MGRRQKKLRTPLERAKSNVGISRALLYKCKAEFGTMLDDFF